jgi:hypothetical protein
MRNSSTYLFFSFFVFTIITFYSLTIPFFWDGTFFSEIALSFYNTGFKHLIISNAPDTGGFPLYSFYLALIWKLFGKTLAVSHFAMLPFILGTIYCYYLLAKKWLQPPFIAIAMLLLICEPVFMTQSILMGYDLFMIFFFMLSLNALFSKKEFLFSIALTLLCASSVRGIILGISLFIIDLLVNKKTDFTLIKRYLFPLLFIVCWAFYHYTVTGWFFFSPVRENTDETIVSFDMVVRQTIYIFWKINDFGRITMWCFVLVACLFLYKTNKQSELTTILKILFIPLLVLILIMAPLSNPIGQKYFIVIFLLLNISVCYFMQMLQNKKLITGLTTVFIVSLLTGNFWIYPQKYGNGWDTSLKIIPYFQLKEEMDLYIMENRIPAEKVGTQFPLISDKKFSHLSNNSFHYTDVWNGPVNNYQYFLYSNIINTNISPQMEHVRKNWILIHKKKAGQVCIELYENPEFSILLRK